VELVDSDLDVQDDEKVYSFNVLTSSTSADMKIFVRESYERLYDLLFLEKYTLINGNPGIGKSYFALYTMYRLMQEKEKAYNIIYVNKVNGYSAFISEDEIKVVSDLDCRDLTVRGNKERKEKTWYIHDCGTQLGKPDMLISSICGRTVVCSSPAKSKCADFVKKGDDYGISTLFMPPWSLLECQAWNTVGNQVNYEERFWHWGGQARKVFSKSYNTTELVQAIRKIPDAKKLIEKLLLVVVICSATSCFTYFQLMIHIRKLKSDLHHLLCLKKFIENW
jgi:hypothetical protein